MKIDIISVVPSPYQRDLFAAMAAEEGCTLRVHYLEDAAPDSPWPTRELARHESILPGWTAGRGRVRCHTNWSLPDFSDADIVVVNAALTGITTQQIMQRLCNQSIPWVFWGEVLHERSGLTGIVQRALAGKLRRASAIIAIGSVAREDYQRRFPTAVVHQLPYFCDLSAFSSAAEIRTSVNPDPVFLFCGQMIARKGIDVLLDAWHSACENGLRARLLLVGREAELKELLSALPDHIRASIEFVGFKAPDQLPEYFASADVFVLPSRHDGWGVVINQAIGAGLPVITTHAVGAARDLIKSEINGLVVEPGNVSDLASALLELGNSQKMRISMSDESKTLRKKLTPRSGARSFLSILNDVLATETALVS